MLTINDRPIAVSALCSSHMANSLKLYNIACSFGSHSCVPIKTISFSMRAMKVWCKNGRNGGCRACHWVHRNPKITLFIGRQVNFCCSTKAVHYTPIVGTNVEYYEAFCVYWWLFRVLIHYQFPVGWKKLYDCARTLLQIIFILNS